MPLSVCFVSTGGICRSPTAGSVFRARVEGAGRDGAVAVDSAGTGGRHEGDGDDPRATGFEECTVMVEAASGGPLAAVREALEERAV
ncbi:hypothetical protein DDQ41_15600 [Streptomyces spongiicola]|uniref:Phosphotyrosine protein phosphatase I domain-containing protein n=1 Tax=Streptomyces spongiicola TaxID=1690221 RepID=A0ABM6V7G5_9ACTN|nr:hypothetical protein [Streptomyces spongiicola]AWK10086.1 hypothetical protein DDQ41_15600 [Streptomyces spongiicola]